MADDYDTLFGLLTSGDVRNDYIGHLIGSNTTPSDFFKFSFKKSTNEVNAQIAPFPNELENFLDNYNSSKTNYKTFLDSIPCAQIRAYVPDSILQMMSDIFSTVVDAIQYGWEMNAKEEIDKLTETGKQMVTTLANIFSNKAGAGTIFYDTLKSELAGTFNAVNANITQSTGLNGQTSIIDFPYLMYYKIMGTTTNAVYEIPTQFPSDFLATDGSFGWNENNKNSSNIFGSNLQAGLLGFILNKLNFSIAPVFNPSGSSSSFDGVEFKFDLINDTREHALNNMNFIYTITGNNKWIQQGVFSSSANLYDVKIPGGQRLFMTKGTFTIAFKGAVRTLSRTLSDSFTFYFGDETRVPEAYSISMKFESVLPGNFNTYMLGLIKGNEDLFAHEKREKGIAGKISNAFSLAFKSAEAVSNAATDILKTNVTTKAVIEANEFEEIIVDNNYDVEWNELVSDDLKELEQNVDIATQTFFNEKVKDFYTQNPDAELTKAKCDEFLEASKDEALEQYTTEIKKLSEKRNELIVDKSFEDVDIDI